MNRRARRGGSKPGKAPPRETVERLVGLCRARRFAEAEPLARECTREWPRAAVGWHALAACSQAAGDAAAAIEAHRRALSIEPDNADGHNNLGLLLLEHDMPGEAVKSFRRALRLRPNFLFAQYNQGLAHEAAGRPEEAAACYRAAIGIDPGFAEAHNHLGNVLHQLDDAAAAEACYRRVLELQPDYAEVHGNLGNVLAERDALDEAEACHRRALELRPGFAEGQANLGNLLRHAGRLRESAEVLRRALELRPDDPGMQANLAATLLQDGRVDEALALYRRVLARQPDSAEAHEDLGNALADAGDMAAAAEAYRAALSLRPGAARILFHLAQVKRFEHDDPDLRIIDQALARADLSSQDHIHLEYAAGKARADIGDDPDRVFAHYREGARLKRATLEYAVEADEARFERIAQAFTPDWFDRMAGAGCDAHAPVFIVGMPRSGTSLVEQMLASHPAVHGAGERPDLRALIELASRERGRAFPEWLADMDAQACTDLGRAYVRDVIEPAGDATRVTDKMPANAALVGCIRAILPNARVIHVRRDPADTCVSCFSYLFSGRQAFSYDLAELGRYYRAHDRLMQHWRTVLSESFLLEVCYEDLVDDPARLVARMLDHCGLEWDDACLQFHRSDRAVRTASARQVREPLYRRAIGRWRPYRAHLDPLFEALGPLAPDP